MTGEYYRGDEARSAKIRNPAIRYAARILGHTIFARQDPGKSKINELCLLHRGLPTSVTGVEPEDLSPVSNAYLFIDEILTYRNYVMQNPDKTPTLKIGGMITPILRHLGVDMSGYTLLEGIPTLDFARLTQAKWGKLSPQGAFIYKWSVDIATYQCLLPQQEYTTPDSMDRVKFELPEDLRYRPEGRRRGRRPANRARESIPDPQGSEDEMPQEPERFGEELPAPPPPPQTDEGRAWAEYSEAQFRALRSEMSYLRRITGWLVRKMSCTTATDAVPTPPRRATFEAGESSRARATRSHTPPDGSDGPPPARRSRVERSPTADGNFSDIYYDSEGRYY